jgi:hypothetical protein
MRAQGLGNCTYNPPVPVLIAKQGRPTLTPNGPQQQVFQVVEGHWPQTHEMTLGCRKGFEPDRASPITDAKVEEFLQQQRTLLDNMLRAQQAQVEADQAKPKPGNGNGGSIVLGS